MKIPMLVLLLAVTCLAKDLMGMEIGKEGRQYDKENAPNDLTNHPKNLSIKERSKRSVEMEIPFCNTDKFSCPVGYIGILKWRITGRSMVFRILCEVEVEVEGMTVTVLKCKNETAQNRFNEPICSDVGCLG